MPEIIDGDDWLTQEELALAYNPGQKRDKAGKFGEGGGVQTKSGSKSDVAKASAVRVDKKIQRYAEDVAEPQLAKDLGGETLPDNEPTDVVLRDKNGKIAHGVELKTMTVGNNDKITMKRSAMERKAEWSKKNKAPFHTVVFDDRKCIDAKGEGKHDFSKREVYYRRGFGSFRVGNMHKVEGGTAGLRSLMDTKLKDLPKGAA